jgi:hypothetical protein
MLGMTGNQTAWVLVIAIIAAGVTISSVVGSITHRGESSSDDVSGGEPE